MAEDPFWEEDDWGDDLQWTTTSASSGFSDDNKTTGGEMDGTPPMASSAGQHFILLIDCHSQMFGPRRRQKTSTAMSIKEEPWEEEDPMDLDRNVHNKASASAMSTSSSPMNLALKLCRQILQERIQDTVKLKIGKRNGVGVILYDTKPLVTTKGSKRDDDKDKDDNHDDDDDEEDDEDDSDDEDDDHTIPRHVHVLMDLSPPGIRQVQTIRECLKGERNICTEFASHDDDDGGNPTSSSSSTRFVPLQTALEEAIRIFRHAPCVRKTTNKTTTTTTKDSPQDVPDTKSIWILTNRPEPFHSSTKTTKARGSHTSSNNNNNRTEDDNDDHRRRLKTVARDCHEHGIQIVVWPLMGSSPLTTNQQISIHNTKKKKTKSEIDDDEGGDEDDNDDDDDDNDLNVFDMSAFYQDIVSYDVFEGQCLGTMEDICNGLDQMSSYWKKIRRLYWGPLYLPGQTTTWEDGSEACLDSKDNEKDNERATMMVDWFRFIQLAKKPNKVQIDQLTKRETIKVKQLLDHNLEIVATLSAKGSSSTTTGLGRLRQFAQFGGEDVSMSVEDMHSIREYANGPTKNQPGLKLLGFKPIQEIPWYHSMSPVYLIYGNDSVMKGSRSAFTELRQAMIRKQVVGIGEVLHRPQWSSRLVALIPMPDNTGAKHASNDDEPEGEDFVDAEFPQGIMISTLPFEDDFRSLEEDEAYIAWKVHQQEESTSIKVEEDEAPDEIPSVIMNAMNFPSPDLIQAAMNLISRHGLDDTMRLGDDFENVALTEFFTYLEEVALELPVTMDEDGGSKQVYYDTRPDESKIAQVLGDVIDDFRKHLPDELESGGGGKGRSRVNLKRKKDTPPDDSGVDWQEVYMSDEWDSIKIPQLKTYLRSQGAPLSGNKTALINRIKDLIKASSAMNVKEEIS